MKAEDTTLAPLFGLTSRTRRMMMTLARRRILFTFCMSLLLLVPTGLLLVPDVSSDISDRGVQEHGKVDPRSIDSNYMGSWADNRNSGSGLVRSFVRKRFVALSEYLSWTEPNSPPIGSLQPVASADAPNGLIISCSMRGGGTSSVMAHDQQGKLVWKTEEWMGPQDNGFTVAPSAGIQAPMVDQEGNLYVSDNSGIWKLDQDDGHVIWFSRFSDYSDNKLASNDLRLTAEGFVGTVMTSGWHIWLDINTGDPVVVKEPDPFDAEPCHQGATFFRLFNGGEIDRSGELDEMCCLSYGANTTAPQPNTVAVAPPIPGRSREHSRYIFTYAGPPGSPDKSRLIAYDFVFENGKWDVEKAWERLIGTDAGGSPTITPDYTRVAAPDNLGRMNLTDVETGASLPEDNSVKFYDFGSPANTIDGWYCTWSPVKCVTAEGNFAVEMNMEPLADIAAQYLPNIESIPLLWSGRPDANLLGGGHYGPLEAHFVAQAGYPFLLGEKIAEEFDLGKHTPHLMFPINYDLRSGELVPGQNWDESLAVPGTSEAHGYLTTSGRYVVQKAELFARMYYYLLQGNVLPDLPSSIVPARWQVGQPIGGFAIYEPESFRDGAWNQADLNVFFVEWALENLCEQPECDLEEAAARLGYASWNLDKVFDKHLDEALTRGEISSAEHDDLHEQGDKAAADCRAARELLLRDQPEDPTTEEISQARSYCESALHGLSIICEVLHTQNSND